MRNLMNAVLVVMVLLLSSGCAGKHSKKSYLREDVDLSFVNKIAVMPFVNHTSNIFVAKRAREIVVTQVLAMGLFDVADKGIVDSRLVEEAISPEEPIDPVTLKRLGQRLSSQAFLMGSVDLAGDQSRGRKTFSELSLTLRLVDANTGLVLWQASGYRNGESLVSRLFGLANDDDFMVTLKLAKDLLRTAPVGFSQ